MNDRQEFWYFGFWARTALVSALFGAFGISGLAIAATETPKAAPSAPAGAKITEEQATAIALQTVPGKVTGVTIEKKRGKSVYVVEIMSEQKGEVDVFVDPISGKVVGTD